jgi:hypothetical protein
MSRLKGDILPNGVPRIRGWIEGADVTVVLCSIWNQLYAVVSRTWGRTVSAY